MTIARKTVVILAGIGLTWVAANAILDFYPDSAEEVRPGMQLTAYQEGMGLRSAFDTLPRYGAGPARVRLLADNNLAWAARWQLIEQAQEEIAISYFILKQDIFGTALLGHLLEKAEQGVKVRVLLDAYGSRLGWHPEGNDYLDTLVNTGSVEVRMYRPLPERLLKGLLDLSLSVAIASEHDKILVADGRRAITGGRNVATPYFAHPDDVGGKANIDMDVEILDKEVSAALIAAFNRQYGSGDTETVDREDVNLASQKRDLELAYFAMDHWLQGEELPGGLIRQMEDNGLSWAEDLAKMKQLKGILAGPLPPCRQVELRVLDSGVRYRVPDDTVSVAAERLLRSTQREVFVQSPYLMLSSQAARILGEASSRDLDLTIFTNGPRSADNALTQVIFLEQWPHILARAPNLRLYVNGGERMVHAKLATFDEQVSLVGTYNLSPLSMATNSELVLAIWSRDFARELTARARERLEAGPPAVYRYSILRTPNRTAQVDEDGNPIVSFGPAGHTDIESMNRIKAMRWAFRAVGLFQDDPPFF